LKVIGKSPSAGGVLRRLRLRRLGMQSAAMSSSALDLLLLLRGSEPEGLGRADQVSYQIETAILMGILAEGDRLPTESVLAAMAPPGCGCGHGPSLAIRGGRWINGARNLRAAGGVDVGAKTGTDGTGVR
jgi:hypothetical protein